MQVKSKQSKKLLFLKSQEYQGGCVKNASAMLKKNPGFSQFNGNRILLETNF